MNTPTQHKMTVNAGLRLIAGIVTLASVLLGYYISAYFFLLTGFVALNQIQSAFSGWCPMMWVLGKLGFRQEIPAS